MDMLSTVIEAFVRKGWRVVNRSPEGASLEKKASSTGLAILLGGISLLILLSYSTLYGAICIGITLLLVALNTVTKRTQTAYVESLPDGSAKVTSQVRRLNQIYSPNHQGKIKT